MLTAKAIIQHATKRPQKGLSEERERKKSQSMIFCIKSRCRLTLSDNDDQFIQDQRQKNPNALSHIRITL